MPNDLLVYLLIVILACTLSLWAGTMLLYEPAVEYVW